MQAGLEKARRMALAVASGAGRFGQIIGHVGVGALAALAFAVCLGIVMRWADIDTDWVFDLNVFALVWLAAVGAALTAFHHSHVTAGIALERFFPRARTPLNVARAVVIIPFLLLVAGAAAFQAYRAFADHEVTFDPVAWPVWIAQVSMPIGLFAWAVVEVAVFIRVLVTKEAPRPHEISGG